MFSQPTFFCEIPFQVSTNHILDIFTQISLGKEFQVLEKELNQIIVIKDNVQPILTAFKSLMCLNNQKYKQNKFYDDGTVCLIKIQIETNQVKCIRIISVKGIIGNYSVNEELIEKFSLKINKLKKKETKQINNLNFINDASEFAQISQQNLQEYYDMLEEQQQIELNHNPYYLENTAFYMFHKILCAYKYGLGKKTQTFINKVQQTLEQDINEHQLKNLVEGITQFTSSIVDTMFMSFNFGKEETKQIMPFCRISVEKFVYLRVYDLIFPKYLQEFKQQDENYRKQTQDLCENEEKIIQKLSIQTKNIENLDEIQRASFELKKISVMTTPREKFRCFQMMIAILKKVQLALHSYNLNINKKICLAYTGLQNPYAEISFLGDSGSYLDKNFLVDIKETIVSLIEK